DWVEEISWSGNLGLTTNITGNQYTLISNGDSTWRAIVDGKPRSVLTASSSSPLVVHLAGERSANGQMWTAQPILSDGRKFFDAFRLFDWNINGVVVKDGTGASVYSLEQLMLSLRNDGAQGGNHRLAIKAEFNKAKSTPAFDAI